MLVLRCFWKLQLSLLLLAFVRSSVSWWSRFSGPSCRILPLSYIRVSTRTALLKLRRLDILCACLENSSLKLIRLDCWVRWALERLSFLRVWDEVFTSASYLEELSDRFRYSVTRWCNRLDVEYHLQMMIFSLLIAWSVAAEIWLMRTCLRAS